MILLSPTYLFGDLVSAKGDAATILLSVTLKEELISSSFYSGWLSVYSSRAEEKRWLCFSYKASSIFWSTSKKRRGSA